MASSCIIAGTRYYTSDTPVRFAVRHAMMSEIAPGLPLYTWMQQAHEVVNIYIPTHERELWQGGLNEVDMLFQECARSQLRFQRDKDWRTQSDTLHAMNGIMNTYNETWRAAAFHASHLEMPEIDIDSQIPLILARMNEAFMHLRERNSYRQSVQR